MMTMQDIFQKYSFHKKASLVGIILASLITAISMNILLVDGTDIGKNLKANVLWSQSVSAPADIFVEWSDAIGNIVAWSNMADVTSLAMSITYNPETTDIRNIYASEWEVIILWNTQWIQSLLLQFPTPRDIISGEVLVSFQRNADWVETVNLIQTNFSDTTDTQYQLSASGDTW